MKRKIKKLQLKKETLRSLDNRQLGQVAGADASDQYHGVSAHSDTCSYPVHIGEEIIVYT